MSRHDHRAALHAELRDDDVEDAIQAVDDAVDRAAALDVDHRIRGHQKQIAGGNHVRAAEVHEAVAISVSVRNVNDLYAVAVEEVAQLHRPLMERVGRPRPFRRRRPRASRRAHPVQHVLVREDRGALPGIRDVARDVAPGEGSPRFRELEVAARMVGVGVRINNVANRLG